MSVRGQKHSQFDRRSRNTTENCNSLKIRQKDNVWRERSHGNGRNGAFFTTLTAVCGLSGCISNPSPPRYAQGRHEAPEEKQSAAYEGCKHAAAGTAAATASYEGQLCNTFFLQNL